jgi:hypothetical protein
MTELFTNIPGDTKNLATTIWDLAYAQKNPVAAANFLHNATEYYRNILSDEEIEFLQFYFNLQMEMMNDE